MALSDQAIQSARSILHSNNHLVVNDAINSMNNVYSSSIKGNENYEAWIGGTNVGQQYSDALVKLMNLIDELGKQGTNLDGRLNNFFEQQHRINQRNGN